MSDGWIKWYGHETPPATGGREVEAELRNGEKLKPGPPGGLYWGATGSNWDIVRYKMVERRKPGRVTFVDTLDELKAWKYHTRRKEDKKTWTRVSGADVLQGILHPVAGTPFLSALTVTPPPGPLPTDAAARKALPAYSGFIAYFPDAIVAVAELSRKGNDQHNPGKPLHWDRSKSGDELDALSRHLLEAGTIDTDGVRHSTKLAWRAMANLQKEIERSRK